MNDNETHERLAVLETKIDTLLARDSASDHEKRLRGLELWRSFLLGAWAVVTGLTAWLVAR